MARSPHSIPIRRYPFTPSIYPGRRPRFSFLLTSNQIYRLKLRTLGKLLKTRGLAPLDERYAILAYGSNACPQQLLNKNLTDVPVLYGRLRKAHAALLGKSDKEGYIPATLARKKGARSSWVTLLTREQLALMDTSEGRHYGTYALAELPEVHFFVGRSHFVPLYTYVNLTRGVMTHAGGAVSLRSTSQKRAKRLLAAGSWANPAEFLDYATIPSPNPPPSYSQIVRR